MLQGRVVQRHLEHEEKGEKKNKTRKLFWLQVMLHHELVYLRKAGEEEKPLTRLNKNSLFLLVKQFMLAIKIRVNKITKRSSQATV